MDASLGETIAELVSGSQNPCDSVACQFKRREHELRLAHGGVRIVVNVDALEKGEIEKGNTVDVWESCKVCGAKTLRSQMSDGT
jgi:1-phosphatidylinositol-3-phosphate 5-kinase